MEFSETCCGQEGRFLWFIVWRISTGCCSYGCSAVLRFGYFDSSCGLYLHLPCLACVRQLFIHVRDDKKFMRIHACYIKVE